MDQLGFDGDPYEIIVDASPLSLFQGNLYELGHAGFTLATAKRSTDGGLTWGGSDAFVEPAGTWAYYLYGVVGGNGTVYAAGNFYTTGYAKTWEIISGAGTGKKGKPQQVRRRNWVVRMLPVGSSSWETIDFHREVSDFSHEARDVGVTPDGTVWVTGYALGPNSGDNLWITRKLSSGASTWTTSEVLAQDGAGQSLATTPAGEVFTGGSLATGNLWTIRALAGEDE